MKNRHPEVVLSEPELKRELSRRTRRDFLIAGTAAAAGVGAYAWIKSAKTKDEVPWPQRSVLDFNGTLARGYVSDSHLMPTYPRSQVGFLKPNGDVGMQESLDGNTYQVKVITGDKDAGRQVSMADIMALPKTEMTTKFCCIEGWSAITSWGGTRFSDFTKKFFPEGEKLPDYVYMATPGEEYYVGLDMKSAMHPQTLLAYEHDGKPLEPQHGAPLRLAIPVKYGIKNIKRIGLIQYTDTRPGDYWAEEGYDWFAGL